MRPRFKHFVIVKFDYPEGYPFMIWKKDQLRWCLLQSLRNQTNKEFVLVFNSTHPMPHEGFGEMIISPVWKDKVREAAEDYDYVITTRLDGDDFVTPDFIQTIQDNFEETDKLILQPNGWIYETRTKMLVDSFVTPTMVLNNFSFIEKVDKEDPLSVQSCYVWAHSMIGKKYKIKFIEEKIHIWCINQESLKAISRPPSRFIKEKPNQLEEFKKLHKIYPSIINIIDVRNDTIKRIKGEHEVV